MHKKTQMPLSQHLSHARRQQIRLLRVVLVKIRHRAASCAKYTCSVKPSCHTGSEACLLLTFITLTEVKTRQAKARPTKDSYQIRGAHLSRDSARSNQSPRQCRG